VRGMERGSIESPLRRVSAGVHDGITPPLGVYSPYIFAGVSPSTHCDTPSSYPRGV